MAYCAPAELGSITELESVHSAICIATVPMMRFISKPPGNMQRSNVYQQNIEMGHYSQTVEKTTLMRMIMVMRRRRASCICWSLLNWQDIAAEAHLSVER